MVNDLDALRRQALDRLGKDERDAADRVQVEFNTQIADVTAKATDGRAAYERMLADASAQTRLTVNGQADTLLATQQTTLATLEAAGKQLKSVETCFRGPIPKVVSAAYSDAVSWGKQRKVAADDARTAAFAVLDQGLSDGNADAVRIFAAPVDQLSALTAPVQDVHHAAGRIRNSIQSLSDLDALRADARDGFAELRNLGETGVTTMRNAGQVAAQSIQNLRQRIGMRTQVARNQWLARARAALAAFVPGDANEDVSALAHLRSTLRKTTSAWTQVLSCLCENDDVVPPVDPTDSSGLGDAACIRPILEVPYGVVLEDYRLKRSFGGRFDSETFSQSLAHITAMPSAHLTLRVTKLTGAPGTLGQALTANPAWEFVGPNNLDVPYTQYYGGGPISGRVNALAYDPTNPNILFAGSAGGGLWRSPDRGMTWQPLSDQVNPPGGTVPVWPDLHVSSIAISPSDPRVIYVGLGDYPGSLFNANGGIMKTTDGGLTWTNVGANRFGTFAVSHILIDPENTNVVIATTGRGIRTGEGQVWRSTDGGNNWSLAVSTAGQWSGAAMGALDPTLGNRAYYVASTLPPVPPSKSRTARIMISTDRALTWTQLTLPPLGAETAFDVAASPTAPGTVYALLSNNHKILRSTDRGATWTDITGSFPNGDKNYNWSQADATGTPGYDDFIACGSRNGKDVVYVGLIDIVLSADGGATWLSIGGPTYSKKAQTHNDQHALALHPARPDEFLLGNDGGVYLGTLDSSHAGTLDTSPSLIVTMQSLNRNLPITMFYRAAFDPARTNVMLGGAQDNATPVSTGDLKNWRNRAGGDGGGVAISPARPNIEYATSQGSPSPIRLLQTLNFFRTDSGWEIHHGPLAGLPTPQQLIPPFVGGDRLPFTSAVSLDPENSTVLYTGTQFLWRLDDDFPLTPWRWHKVSSTALSTTGVIQRIAVAPSSRDTIYTASNDGEVWASFDRGATWKRLNGGGIAPCFPVAGGGFGCPSANALSVNLTDPNDVLVGYSQSVPAGSPSPQTLFRCTGTNTANPAWTDVSGAGTAALPNVALNAVERDLDSPGNTFFAGTDVGVFMTTDGGVTWADIGTPFGLPRVQVNDLVAVPKTRFLNAATFGRGIWRLPL